MVTKNEIEQIFEILELKLGLGTFQDRIKLQKIVYLTEHAFGINLGLSFDWYIHGPYSPDLTKIMFEKEPGITMKLTESKINELKKFKEFFRTHTTSNSLELLGSLHYFLSVVKGKNHSKEKTIEQFLELKPKFTNKEVKKYYSIINTYV